MTAKDMFSHRVSILTGHYGTGKTEVSVNLALALAAEGEQVMLADLDIVNNTHLCGETTPAEIRKGVALAQEVSRQTGIPILCHTAERRFLESLSDLGEPVFPIAINMKKPWER